MAHWDTKITWIESLENYAQQESQYQMVTWYAILFAYHAWNNKVVEILE